MKTLRTAMLMLSLSVAAISCDKDTTTAINITPDIAGNWTVASYDFYYDDKPIEFNKTELGIYCLMEDNSTQEFYDPLGSGLGALISFNFDKNGSLYIMGTEVAKWKYENGELILTNTEGESASLGSVSDGYIDIETDSAQVLGYQFREMFNYDPIDNWIGYDGNLHEIRYVTRLKK